MMKLKWIAAILASVCVFDMAAQEPTRTSLIESIASNRARIFSIRGLEAIGVAGTESHPEIHLYLDQRVLPINGGNLETLLKPDGGLGILQQLPADILEVLVLRNSVPVPVTQFDALQAKMGTSTSNLSGCFAGTLGMQVAHATPTGWVTGYITNNHVATAEIARLCPNGDGSEKDQIRQVAPGLLDRSCDKGKVALLGSDVVAIPIDVTSDYTATPWNRVDAAFVKTNSGTIDSANKCGICPADLSIIDPTVAATDQIPVRKCGRGSATPTTGKVSAAHVSAWVHYRCGLRALFEDQIIVDGATFAHAGDSGSVAYGKTKGVLGMLFAGSGDQTLVNPMQIVLDRLNLKIDPVPQCK